MKLYAHWDGDQPFTKVIKLDDHGTVADLRAACWQVLTARHPDLAASGPGALRLTGADRRPLSLSSCIADVLTSGDDVFYRLNSPAAQPSGGPPDSTLLGQRSSPVGADHSTAPSATPTGLAASNGHAVPSAGQEPSRPAEASATSPQAAGHGQTGGDSRLTAPEPAAPAPGGAKPAGATAGGPASPSPSGSGSAGTAEALAPVVRALWLRAEEAAAQLHYRGAGEILQQALHLVPEPSSPTHIATLMRLARLWLSAGNPGAAVPWALRAAQQRPQDPGVLELAGDCLREGGRPREAAAQYQSALEALQEGRDGEELGKQASTRADADSAASSPPLLRLRLSLAACLAALPGSISPPYDNQDLAASLVMAVLEAEPGHWEALALYARIALERGLREDALRVALRLVVGRPKHAGGKALLAECLKDEAGCRQLYDELGLPYLEAQSAASGVAAATGNNGSSSSSSNSSSSKDGGTAAALAFVATAVKDYGKVDTCISLLRRACCLDPASPGYVLNLVHALELRQGLQQAVEAGRDHCRSRGAQLAGRQLRDVAALLSGLPELRNPLELTWYLSEPLWGAQQRQQQLQHQHPSVASQAPEQEQERREGAAGKEAQGEAGTQRGAAAASAQVAPVKVSYSSDELDELALLFTLAKVLFVGGALTAAARLCELVEPLRCASAVELHTTLIRNEAAYFGCVAQLMRDYPPPPARLPAPPGAAGSTAAGADAHAAASPSGSAPPLYLVGDSHCLSAAWRLVTLRGEQRLLRPLLVTGCKVWHLRPASEFYPKKQFEVTMRLLPDGAQVVLVLGEIDCREGLLLAVQKGKYDSVAEGIDATVAIYMDVLRALVSERSMEVFVHPVPPVLNETRGVVAPFTAALRAAVATARAADPALRRRLHYLDFFDQLLVPRQQQHGSGSGDAAAAAGAAAAAAAPTGGSVAGASGAAAAAAVEAVSDAPAVPSAAAGAVSAQRKAAEVAGGGGGDGGAAADGPAAGSAGWALRPDLAFDGTHLAPTYVSLLDAALSLVA
ncbi:hypothetical protein PLESTB_001084900 [Pleodorina starrii]|uniref:Ancillary SecYEG translocon subunit/Cell division coordinator CpoB TPR domain-containing protein n=1 Tax=Pleodorina starrii TaxID=330485 RepID=A0A9W6BQI9_9CHLO|nr:hypothetical protein PLESTM_000701100 [Pleodorina starrii]GLC56253.1 hypothetical protein PLESTB_001084900 [Pleodorina starrii]GLC70317.1 hypothetical protein PLESTF_000958900 [Pleodorina starrii]